MKLYGFWPYDSFPYYLGEEITDIDSEKGRAFAKGYGSWFRTDHMIFVVGERGRELIKLRNSYKYELDTEIKKLRESSKANAITDMPELKDLIERNYQ